MRNFAVVVLVFLATSAHAGIFGPSTYEECILENMKNIQSDQAARAIAAVCRQKFPKKEVAVVQHKSKPLSSSLSNEIVNKIGGKAGFSSSYFGPSYFSGNIYNPSEKATMTSVTIMLSNDEMSEKYRIDIEVPPQSSRDFKVKVSEGFEKNHKWGFVAAEGYGEFAPW